MTNEDRIARLERAVGDLQRLQREYCGYAPNFNFDFLDVSPELEVEGPAEQIGTGIYRLADGEVVGHEPDPPEF